MTTLNKTLATLVSMMLSGAAQAALIDRGGGMINDTYSKVTWLADMNYAHTSGYSGDGLMGWAAAHQWADQLEFGGYTDWRLPNIDIGDTTCDTAWDPGNGLPVQHYGFGCKGSELSHLMLVDFGINEWQSVLDQTGDTPQQIANLALFRNVQSGAYWFSQPYQTLSNYGWVYFSSFAYVRPVGADYRSYVVAVRDGDVVGAVPEPQTWALMLTGLAACALGTRRYKR